MRNKLHFIFYILTLLIGLFALTQGSYYIEPLKIIMIFCSKIFNINSNSSSEQELILLTIRLPRIILVILIGANLSVSGSVLQSIFKNPLVSPFILGISAGASFGASLVIAFFSVYNIFTIQISAFVFGIISVLLVLVISRTFARNNIIILLLTGVIVSSLFISLLSLIQYFTREDKIQSILFWTFGSFANSSWTGVLQMLPITLFGIIMLLLYSFRIDIISLGDTEAESLGINVSVFRIILIVIISLMTSSSVAVCGPIGWIGLIIPHIVRIFVGSKSFKVILSSIGLGASFLLIVDLASRLIVNIEIPVGIITSILGAPFFLIILYFSRKKLI